MEVHLLTAELKNLNLYRTSTIIEKIVEARRETDADVIENKFFK